MRGGGDEAAHLGHDDQQRRLAQISGFAAHVGAGEEQDRGAFGGEIEIVGDEAAFGVLLHAALDDRMARGCGFENALFGERGARVVAQCGDVGEVGEQIELGDYGCAAADARRCFENGGAQLGEEAAFDLDGALVRGEDAGLVVLQLGRGEALGVDQGLFALVVGGDGLEVGLGDLDVVAEDIVKANL